MSARCSTCSSRGWRCEHQRWAGRCSWFPGCPFSSVSQWKGRWRWSHTWPWRQIPVLLRRGKSQPHTNQQSYTAFKAHLSICMSHLWRRPCSELRTPSPCQSAGHSPSADEPPRCSWRWRRRGGRRWGRRPGSYGHRCAALKMAERRCVRKMGGLSIKLVHFLYINIIKCAKSVGVWVENTAAHLCKCLLP